jgi:NAD(P)-dependent dehydrogenase (short-subunit alcohol dehydrogenase family)
MSDRPDLSGKVVVITGGNTGIGKETAVALAEMGATTVITSRDAQRGVDAVGDIQQRSGRQDVHVVSLDLASFESIRRAAAEILERWDRLDVLVNNAGGIISGRRTTEDGFEMTFGVNHLGHFLLTDLLLDRLKQSAPSRIVNVSSTAHRGALRGINFDDLQREHGYNTQTVYGESKLANILFTRELARRLEGTGVTAYSLHPGVIRSGFGMDGDTSGPYQLMLKVGRPFLTSVATGARTTIHVASAPERDLTSGAYYVRRRKRKPSGQARDDAAARRLWEVSEQLVAQASASD